MHINKLYDIYDDDKYQNLAEKPNYRNKSTLDGYIKKSTVCLIVVLTFIIAAILSAGSGILVYLMTSRELECKLVMNEGLPNTGRPELTKTTTRTKTTLGDVETANQYLTPVTTSPKVSTPDANGVKTSAGSTTSAGTKSSIRTKLTVRTSAAQTTDSTDLPERTTKNHFSEETSTVRTTTEQEMSCPSGWMKHASSCYHFSNVAKNWQGALAVCSSNSGRLVEIYDKEADTVLRNEARARNGDFWIGLTDLKTEGVWIWNGSSTLLTSGMYTNWAPSQPDDGSGSEDCALIKKDYSFMWNDDQCYNLHRYICEKKLK